VSKRKNIMIQNPSRLRIRSKATKRNMDMMTCGIEWPAFLAQQDPIWERLPETWMEGTFIGNGRLGAMIYRGHGESEPGADVLAWTIGRSDLYDDRDTGDAWLNNGQRSGFDMGGNCRLLASYVYSVGALPEHTDQHKPGWSDKVKRFLTITGGYE